jgi:hypothetical protein
LRVRSTFTGVYLEDRGGPIELATEQREHLQSTDVGFEGTDLVLRFAGLGLIFLRSSQVPQDSRVRGALSDATP